MSSTRDVVKMCFCNFHCLQRLGMWMFHQNDGEQITLRSSHQNGVNPLQLGCVLCWRGRIRMVVLITAAGIGLKEISRHLHCLLAVCSPKAVQKSTLQGGCASRDAVLPCGGDAHRAVDPLSISGSSQQDTARFPCCLQGWAALHIHQLLRDSIVLIVALNYMVLFKKNVNLISLQLCSA